MNQEKCYRVYVGNNSEKTVCEMWLLSNTLTFSRMKLPYSYYGE